MRSWGTVWALALACLGAAGCSVPVVAGLDESDASQVVVALEQSGVASEKARDPDKEGAYRVTVARDDAGAALAVLAEQGLPPPASPGVLEALGKGSMVPSRVAEHARVIAGTSDELERSLRGLDGVLSARVHLGVPGRDPLELDEKPPAATASVLLRHRGATPPLTAAEVQRLVAGAVPGLSPEQVSVVMLPAAPRPRPPDRQLARLGPLTVTHASLFALRGIIGVAAVLNAALLACVVGLWLRLRRAEHELRSVRGEDDAAPHRASAKPAQLVR
jgi:type III secretion protein J